MSTNYRLIGSGKTDANGVAHITKDAEGQTLTNPGYVGVGAGEIDVVASMDNPVISGSVVSETSGVLDCTFYDTGIDGTANSNWSGTLTRTPSANGTVVTTTNTWQRLYAVNNSFYFNNPFVVEFEVVAYSDTPSIKFINSNNTAQAYTIVGTGKYRFEFKSDAVKLYKDGTEVSVSWMQVLAGLNLAVYWEFSATTDELTYKDFKIYPI